MYNKTYSCDLREEISSCGWIVKGTWEELESVNKDGDY
jgi:hypothetical protein